MKSNLVSIGQRIAREVLDETGLKASKLGAKRITIVGVSTNGVRNEFDATISADSRDKLINGIEILPEEVGSAYLTPERIKIIKGVTKNIVPSDVGFIDAVAIEF